jgi:hypothetical protein
MRKKYFYTHLIDTSSLALELENMNLTPEEKSHLFSLIDSNIHHEILDLILSELSSHDKKTFLNHLSCENHDKVWKFLREKIRDVESKIKKSAEDLKNELHKDIKEVKATA